MRSDMIVQSCRFDENGVHLLERCEESMEEDWSQTTAARRIAIAAGVLEVCEIHDDIILNTFSDNGRAYQLGNAEFNAGKLEAVFATHGELNEAIKSAIDDAAVDGCSRCHKLME